MEIIASIILSIVQSVLFYSKELGISVILFEIIANGIIYYVLYKKNRIQNKLGILLMIPIILLSSTYFIFANTKFYIANIFVLLALNLIMYVIVTNKKDYLKNHLYAAFKLLTGTLSGIEEAAICTKEISKEHIKTNKKVNKESIEKVFVSILIVLAIASVVIGLLISADSIFAELFSGTRNLFKNINFSSMVNLLVRLAIIVIVYFLVLSLVLKLQKEYIKEEKEMGSKKTGYTFTIKLLLITLNIVYLVFCYIQIHSLFAKININEINYANYARTGFFQLMFVSLINFAVILISNKYNENNERIIKILNLLLVAFTIIIAASAMYRMYMYETQYGLTYLRAFVYIILVTEITAFIPIVVYIFNEKFDFIKWCFIIGICSYCVANYLNLENIIISKNISRDEVIDYNYISKIVSEDSYEILEEKLNKEDISDNEKLDILKITLRLASNKKDLAWQEFNIQKWKMSHKDINIIQLNKQIRILEEKIKESQKNEEMLPKKPGSYFYTETINENEIYFVEQVDAVMGDAVWRIWTLTNNGTKYNIINTLEVKTPSKIKFFENGLGFLEKPDSIYCAKSDLLITHDGGKNFEPIEFPQGTFTLSDPKRRKMGKLL